MALKNTRIKVVPITVESLGKIADIHCEAFKGYMNSRIGKGYVAAFFRWFSLQEDAVALMVITENNEPCGYVVGAPLGYDRRMNRALFGAAAKGMIVRPWLAFDKQMRRTVMTRIKLLFGQTIPKQQAPDLPEPIISLVGIGTAEKSRGQGAGNALMAAFEDEARKHNMASMRLSVYPSNTAARRLYEKCGWLPFTEPETEGLAMYYYKIL